MDLIQKILNKVEEEAKQEEANRPVARGIYRASEIGGCGRAIQYARLKYQAEPNTPETHLLFKDGHVHHNAVRELLGKVGTLSSVETSISKRYKHKGVSFVITGTLDGKFDGEPFDIKSISTFRFKFLDRDYPTEYMNYVCQLTVYLDILGQSRGFFIFKDKNTSELKIKEVLANPTLMTQILDRIASIHNGIKSKTLMDRPYERTDWHCRLCQFRLACWKLAMESRRWSKRAWEGAKDGPGSRNTGR